MNISALSDDVFCTTFFSHGKYLILIYVIHVLNDFDPLSIFICVLFIELCSVY